MISNAAIPVKVWKSITEWKMCSTATSCSSLSTSCFICKLQGCASSQWNDLLTGTPPSTQTHGLSEHQQNTLYQNQALLYELLGQLPQLQLLICDPVNDVFPHQTSCTHNTGPWVAGCMCVGSCDVIRGVLWGHYVGSNRSSMCLLKFSVVFHYDTN